ncbi:MAG TPA: antitoxin VapB family protein [Thermoplasmata archaeon]|nr:antitoxin VapB family protein [Thermoplasmata archaeon]
MPSRNIAVQETVYEALMKEKRPGESFTSVLRRLLDQRGGVEELSGAWGTGRRQSRDRLRSLRASKQGGRR